MQFQYPDVATDYATGLNELEFNSKPIINNLTIIAQENIHAYRDIVKVIEEKIARAPPAQKLPLLYLIDSIAKNVGGVYITEFARNIVLTFCRAYEAQPDHDTRMLYLRLLKTWPVVFPPDTVRSIEQRLRESSKHNPKFQYDQLERNVHVNPTYFQPNQSRRSGQQPQRGYRQQLQQPQRGYNQQGRQYQQQQQYRHDGRGYGAQYSGYGYDGREDTVTSLSRALQAGSSNTTPNSIALIQQLQTTLQQELHDGRQQSPQITALLQQVSALLAQQQQQQQQQQPQPQPQPQQTMPSYMAPQQPPAFQQQQPMPMYSGIPQQQPQPQPSMMGGYPQSQTFPPIPTPTTYIQPIAQSQQAYAQPYPQSTTPPPATDLLSTLTNLGFLSQTAPQPQQQQTPIYTQPQMTIPPAATTDRISPLLHQQQHQPLSRHDIIINSLYHDIPFQCSTCGLRFKDQEVLARHLDKHFEVARKEKENKALSRRWLQNVDDWLEKPEPNPIENPGALFFGAKSADDSQADGRSASPTDLDAAQAANCVVADDAHDTCPVCGDKFETCYDNQSEEWMFKNAMHVTSPVNNASAIVHPACAPSYVANPHKRAMIKIDGRASSSKATKEEEEGGKASATTTGQEEEEQEGKASKRMKQHHDFINSDLGASFVKTDNHDDSIDPNNANNVEVINMGTLRDIPNVPTTNALDSNSSNGHQDIRQQQQPTEAM